MLTTAPAISSTETGVPNPSVAKGEAEKVKNEHGAAPEKLADVVATPPDTVIVSVSSQVIQLGRFFLTSTEPMNS